MVCATAVLSSSLALSLLRQSSTPSQSFVFSPFSLNTALSIVNDGASGTTQTELTNLLLNGCSPSDVSDYYSTMTLSLPMNKSQGVLLRSANRLYVASSVTIKEEYQKNVEDKYKVKVEGIDLSARDDAAKAMNDFVEAATNGKIRQIISPNAISDSKTILINAVHFIGHWENVFFPYKTASNKFKGVAGERDVDFMNQTLTTDINDSEFGTALILPYEDNKYKFFFLMPKESTNLEQMRNDLTGEKLVEIISKTQKERVDISVPKFKVESELNGVDVLKKLGVSNLFSDGADLSKISDSPLKISNILHRASIETSEYSTEAAAATATHEVPKSSGKFRVEEEPRVIVIDRPFLYGILRNEDILFLGQLV